MRKHFIGAPIRANWGGDVKPFFGNGIAVGVSEAEQPFAAYFIAERDPTAVPLKLSAEVQGPQGKIYAAPADLSALGRANSRSPIYDAIQWAPGILAAGSGPHTADIFSAHQNPLPWKLERDTGWMGSLYRRNSEMWKTIAEALATTRYPRYAPTLEESVAHVAPIEDAHRTPRISGRVSINGFDSYGMTLAIARCGASGEVARAAFPSHNYPGMASLITTYARNAPQGEPLPPYAGKSQHLHSVGSTPEDIAQTLEAHMGDPAFRVALAVVLWDDAREQFVPLLRNYRERGARSSSAALSAIGKMG